MQNKSKSDVVGASKTISNFLSQTNRQVHIVNYDINSDLMETFISDRQRTTIWQLKSMKKTKIKFEIDQSAIITLESTRSLKVFNKNVILTSQQSKNLKFMLTLKISRHLIKINRYYKDTNTWHSSIFSKAKFSNFHGCKMVLGFQFQPPAMFFDPFKFKVNGLFKYSGYICEILKNLAINLSYVYAFRSRRNSSKNYFYKNVSVGVLVTKLPLHLHFFRMKSCFITRPFVFKSSFIFIPPG